LQGLEVFHSEYQMQATVGITLQWAMVMNGSFLAEYYSTESSIKLCTVHTLLVCV